MSLPLFVYGSMLDGDVLEIALGRGVPGHELVPAVLPHHRRVKVPDESYPFLLSGDGEEVWGVLLGGLSGSEWARLRFFEGEEYRLVSCEVLVAGTITSAQYFGGAQVAPGGLVDWCFSEWKAQHKGAYLPRIQAFMALFERGDLDGAEALWESSR